MDEYIKKQDIYDELSKDYDYLTNYGKGYVDATIRMVKAIPAADVVEVRHGRWQSVTWGDFDCCSVCGCSVERQQFKYYYCPKCGTKMDEKSENYA